ncbi:hypothetical protein IM792_18415 [Mucilaginibacter sp. JRF]|uniref:hypothetical protein n=1 Tax=Mucilaginibacter sp. JRF TaxID=2780088 RepID=UPI001881653E|nr:hypothetical protein [Mucilaginibacter sp. JRF]MBE9586433.1 hypothetical protein [Mucilaginibacter sp. JRF]
MFLSRKVCLIITISILTLLQACSQQSNKADGSAPHKYSLYIRLKNNAEYIVQCDSLTGGTIDPEKQGTPLDIHQVSRDIIVKDNFYYHMGFKNDQFIKYKVSGKVFQKVDSVAMPHFSIENFRWMGKDTLQIIGLQAPSFTQVVYSLINTDSMKVISTGKLDIPHPGNGFNNMSVGFAEPLDSNLVIGYTYHKPVGTTSYTTSDTMYTSLVSITSGLLNTDKDTRSTYPAGVNNVQSYTFYDEHGDFYFMTCPGIALGNRPDVPTGVFRIKKGELAPDKKYFFNLSASVINNHAYGLWYLSKGKAIVRSERKDLYHDLNDHYSAAHFEFYVLDLAEQTATKINLPLDKGTRRECVIVEGDKAYISINSDKQGDFIWIYDIKTGETKKGLQLTGHTDYILRMDRL